jgi:CRP/FNR family cyclic AMP-dependent transcriptional regulator
MDETSPTANTTRRGRCVLTGALAELWPPDEKHVTVRSVSHGQNVTAAGDSPDTVYYVRTGLVKAIRHSDTGGEVVIDYYREGTLFGGLCFCEWPLCEEGIKREVALTVEDSEIVAMTFDVFKQRIREQPEALLGLLADYCRRLAAARVRIESFVLHPAEGRLVRALLMMAAQYSDTDDPVTLQLSVTHEELAHLIGISRQLVTKLIGKLRGRGLIETPRARCLVIHRQKMSQAFNL